MSQYFEYKCELSGNSSAVLSTGWSCVDRPVLAVSTEGESGGVISFMMEEGEKIDDMNITRQSLCHTLAWNPKAMMLASGWDDGVLSLFHEKDKSKREDLTVHKGKKITLLVWSPEGSRLICGDEGGTVSIWSVDQKGRLVHVCQYARKGALTHVAFRSVQFHSNSCPPFFCCFDNGLICLADDIGNCTDVVNLGSEVCMIHYNPKQDTLISLVKDMTLFKFKFREGELTQERKVKLSMKGDGSNLVACWAGAGLLASANNETMIRIWHLDHDTNYVLSLTDSKHMAQPKDTITSICYNSQRNLLAGGTSLGRVCFWSFCGNRKSSDPGENDWSILPPVNIMQPVINLCFGVDGLIAVTIPCACSILNETVLNFKQSCGNAIIQLSTEKLIVQTSDGKLNTNIKIKGIDIINRNLLVWNGKNAEVHEISDGNISQLSTFPLSSKVCALHREDLFCISGSSIEIRNLQGTVKKVISFTELEGYPVLLDVWVDFVVVCTNKGILKLWDISRREHKTIVPGRSFDTLGNIRSLKVNSKGTKISLLCDMKDSSVEQETADQKIYLYDVEMDKIEFYDFGPEFFPTGHFWDPLEPRLICVSTRKVDFSAGKLKEDELDVEAVDNGNLVQLLFTTPDNGILLQDSFAQALGDNLIGLDIPSIFFMSTMTGDQKSGGIPKIKKKTMRDFVGLENVDNDTRADLINFSYNLTIGNMDEAYRCVKKIQSTSIWENMAAMCVKTKRLDVSEVCLGNLGNAKGAMAVRLAKNEPEKEVAVAMLAIQLGMISDAERLYKECGRYDLLADLFKSTGKWDQALEFCEKYDRIRLKTLYYEYASYLESMGDTKNAIKMFEKSNNHRKEVPRLLFAAGLITELEQYVKTADDCDLFKWFASYCESMQRVDDAIKYYSYAKDYMSIIRIYCCLGRFDKASSYSLEKNDLAAFNYLAKQLENQGKIRESISFYHRGGRFNHAIRLSIEHNLHNELHTMALESEDKHLRVLAARFFEESGDNEKAVLLYQKGGDIPHALELCFRAELFDSLSAIAADLGPQSDPALLSRCGDFFLSHSQFEKAISLYVMAKHPHQALDVCVQNNIALAEDVADKMTAEKLPSTATEEEKEERNTLLKRIAKVARDQNQFLLACKKYSNANEKVKAMKCLLKHGDSEKIIYYATHTKKPEIYVLAANYMQNLDWHQDPEIIKSVVKFYSLAGAWNQLSDFYQSMSQIEMDDYRDYEKGLLALKECLKYTVKARADTGKDEALTSLDLRIKIVERFVEARRAIKTDPSLMINICLSLLDAQEVEQAIRVGDVFALLIEYYHAQNTAASLQQAFHLMERMKDRSIVLRLYLDQNIIDRVYNAMGITSTDVKSSLQEDADFVEEDIPDDN